MRGSRRAESVRLELGKVLSQIQVRFPLDMRGVGVMVLAWHTN